MPRLPRNETEAGLWHVFARGVERRLIFLDDDDRRTYLRLLRGVAETFRWHCLAYCLMPNHVHLLIETTEPNLGRGMHALHGMYAQSFNQKWNRVGHLFQSRFGSRVVPDDLGLMRVLAYIEANPVAARLCATPDDWPWSSFHRTVAGRNGRVPDVDRLTAHIAPQGGLADVYRALVSGALPVSA
jgi:REP element-mobilizing transposase RayT